MSKNTIVLIEVALFAALAMALSLLPKFFGWFSPSLGAIPLTIFSLRRGLKPGLAAGFIWGILHFPLGDVYYLSLIQVIIEYVFAFIPMGLAGLAHTKLQRDLTHGKISSAFFVSSLGAALAVLGRYIFHFIAGIVFWASYAPEGTSATVYSLSVNGTAGLSTLLFVIISLGLLLAAPQARSFFLPKR